MSIDSRNLEAELVTNIEDKSIKDCAILDLKRKWEREDNTTTAKTIRLFVSALLIAALFYFLGHYYAEQHFVRDILKIASVESKPGETYEDFYSRLWDYLYDNYRVNLR